MKSEINKYFYEEEGRGIPFEMIKELFMFCPYGSVFRVACKLLYYTGCRISELENMKITNLCGNFIFWECGKGQRAWRKEYLPDYFIEEIFYYRNQHKGYLNRIISIKSKTLTRYFRKFVRPNLSDRWHKKTEVIYKGAIRQAYIYQVKGFRKNFATLLFYHYWRKYGDSGVAVERVAKRLRHSSRHITVNHYIETIEQIQAEKFFDLSLINIEKEIAQKRIVEYIE